MLGMQVGRGRKVEDRLSALSMPGVSISHLGQCLWDEPDIKQFDLGKAKSKQEEKNFGQLGFKWLHGSCLVPPIHAWTSCSSVILLAQGWHRGAVCRLCPDSLQVSHLACQVPLPSQCTAIINQLPCRDVGRFKEAAGRLLEEFRGDFNPQAPCCVC